MKRAALVFALSIAASALVPGGTSAASTFAASPTAAPIFQLVPAAATDLPIGSLSFTPGASTTPSALAASSPWTCVVFAGDPVDTVVLGRPVIEGSGHQTCTGSGFEETRITIAVQQYRGLGRWAQKVKWDSGYAVAPSLYGSTYWTCAAGSGNQLYRIVTQGFAESGAYSATVQSVNDLRVTCP
jgi:hypothetical protein